MCTMWTVPFAMDHFIAVFHKWKDCIALPCYSTDSNKNVLLYKVKSWHQMWPYLFCSYKTLTYNVKTQGCGICHWFASCFLKTASNILFVFLLELQDLTVRTFYHTFAKMSSMILTQTADEIKHRCRKGLWDASSNSRISKQHKTVITHFSLETTSAFSPLCVDSCVTHLLSDPGG